MTTTEQHDTLEQHDTPAEPQPPKPRFAQPRTLIRWSKKSRLQVLKMLAWVIYDKEHVHNAAALVARVDALYERIVRVVLGEERVTLDAIRQHTLAEQGAEITPVKLLQRADKTDRYCEFNQFKDVVVQAYEATLRVS